MVEPQACFIGGDRYDSEPIESYLRMLDHKLLIVTGDALGAEERVRTSAKRRGFRVHTPRLHTDLGPAKALKLQVVDIYVQALLGGKLVLIGKGKRVDAARDMLGRSSAWPMEVEEL